MLPELKSYTVQTVCKLKGKFDSLLPAFAVAVSWLYVGRCVSAKWDEAFIEATDFAGICQTCT